MTRINRHNYEEFFILYLDNELNREDRRMVEAFIAQHPDLREELELLQQFKLEPDPTITYTGKEDLLKMNGSSPITAGNYEEWLQLYIDDELDAGQKNMVEHFLAENSAARDELSLYKRSKLQPETVVFDHKEMLYRQEKIRRLVPAWWRVAAAVLLVIGGTAAVMVFNKAGSSKNGDMAGTTTDTEKVKIPVQDKQPVAETPVAVIVKQEPVAPASIFPANERATNPAGTVAVTKNNTGSQSNTTNQSPALQSKKEEQYMAVTKQPDNNLPKPVNNPNLADMYTAPAQEKALANVPKNSLPAKEVLTNPVVTTQSSRPSDDIVAASFINNDQQLEETDGKKNKLRGFFRKVTRTFEKRTNIDATDEDGKLLVAGLAIKLK